MAEYGKVYKKIWNNERFRQLSEKAKYLFLYLITSPHTNTLGLFRLPLSYISSDVDWQTKTVLKYLGELKSASFLLWDTKSCLVCIPSWLEHNPIISENHLKKCLAELSEIPKNPVFMLKLKEMTDSHTDEYAKIISMEIEKSYLSFSDSHTNSEEEAVTEAVTEAILPKASFGHKEAIAYFSQTYQNKLGIPYNFKGGKDGKHIKSLLATFGLDGLKALIDQLFDTKDEFVQNKAGQDIGVLYACANKLARQLVAKQKGLDKYSPATITTLQNIARIYAERERKANS